MSEKKIESGIRSGLSLRNIGKSLGRPASCISREIRRNGPRIYDAVTSQRKSMKRACMARSPAKLDNDRLWDYVYNLLSKRWSPELISGRLQQEYPETASMNISPESIYKYLYVMPKGELRAEVLQFLRQSRKNVAQGVGAKTAEAALPICAASQSVLKRLKIGKFLVTLGGRLNHRQGKPVGHRYPSGED